MLIEKKVQTKKERKKRSDSFVFFCFREDYFLVTSSKLKLQPSNGVEKQGGQMREN